MNRLDFGKFLSQLRKEKGWTQAQLARELNVTDKAVSRWETGRNYPDIEFIEKLALLLDVSVSELIEGKRISRDDILSVSENQVVKQIKEKRHLGKKYRIIITVLFLFVGIFSGYVVAQESGLLAGVIYNEIDCYSNDVVTILNNVDGYITGSPKAEGEYIVDNGWISIEKDKSTNDILYLSGTTENGRYFYVNVYYDDKDRENSSCFIGEMRENRDVALGVPIKTLKQVVLKLDSSLWEGYEKLQLEIMDMKNYINSNLEKNDYQASLKKFVFSDGILSEHKESTISGTYVRLILVGFNGNSGENIGYVFCEVEAPF